MFLFKLSRPSREFLNDNIKYIQKIIKHGNEKVILVNSEEFKCYMESDFLPFQLLSPIIQNEDDDLL